MRIGSPEKNKIVTCEKCKLLVERSIPLGAAAAALAGYHYLVAPRGEIRDLKDILQSALNVAAIAIGFIISAKAILISIGNSHVVKVLRAGGQFAVLIQYFLTATWWNASAALASGGLLWLDVSRIGPHKQIALHIWVFCCGAALGSSIRVVWLFGKLMKRAATGPGDS